MKKTICLILFWVIASTGFSQYYYLSELNNPGNPGGLNTEGDQASFTNTNWTQILGSGAIVYSASISIPFAFNFDGAPVTNFLASPTGYLTFDLTASGTPPSSPQILPSGLLPDKTVCAAWGVNLSGANDAVITQVFGTAPNRQFSILWRSASSPGSPNGTTWNYFAIVLEETSDNIYLVDLWQAGVQPNMTLGVQIDGATAEQVAGSPTYKGLFNPTDNPSDNDYYLFIQGVQPSYDISLSTISVPDFLDSANAPFTITGSLINYGTTTITSFDINYSVDGGSTVSSNISAVNIPTNNNYLYSHPNTWTPAMTGTYNITVWASNINGNADQNNSNDTLVKQTVVYTNAVPRLVLHEGFASSTSPPVAPANVSLHSVLDANPGKYTLINYQMSWVTPGDPYYTLDGNDRRNYYGLNTVPHLLVDGGFDANTANYTQTDLDNGFVVPTFLAIGVNISIVGQKVSINTEIIPRIAYPSNNMVVHTVITEKRTYNNVATNGETEFRNVMKKMVPDANGTPIAALAVGDTVKLSANYTFQGNYRLPSNAMDPIDHSIEHSVEDFNNLEVIVFVQDAVTMDVLNSVSSTGTVCIPGTTIPEICLVTVDENTNENKIVWEYNQTNLDSFRIYRDIVGTYTLVGVISTDSLSVFVDRSTGVNPAISSYRYRISSIDSCSIESFLSPFHESIHLRIIQSAGETLTLIWDSYKGFSFPFYRILKDANGSGNFVVIDSVSNTNTTYTDFNPGASDSITYIIEVILPNVCVAGKVLDFSSTKSNPASIKSVGIDDLLVEDNFNLYPNPSFGIFTLSGILSSASDLRIVVSDLLGKEVYTEQVPNKAGPFKKQVHLSRSGMYLVKISTSQGSHIKKILIQ